MLLAPGTRPHLWEEAAGTSCNMFQGISSVWLEVPGEAKAAVPSLQWAGVMGQSWPQHGHGLGVCMIWAVPGWLLGDHRPLWGYRGGRSRKSNVQQLRGHWDHWDPHGSRDSPCEDRPAAGPEPRRPCGLAGGHACGARAWLLKRGRGACPVLWGCRGSCRQVGQVDSCFTHIFAKGARYQAGSGVRLLACIPRVEALRKGLVGTWLGGGIPLPAREASPETKLTSPLIWDFLASGMEKIKFCSFSCPICGVFYGTT